MGESFGKRRLGHAGNALEQDVARGEESDQELMRNFLHAHNDAGDFPQRAFAQVADLLGELAHGVAVGAGVGPMIGSVRSDAARGGLCEWCHVNEGVWNRKRPSATAALRSSS